KKGKEGSTIYELNPETFEYEDRKKLKSAATEMAKQEKETANKLKAPVKSKGDRAGEFVWNVLKPVMLYSARLIGVIADDIVSIDNAMKWGFGWEVGPFAPWDAIGVEKSVERMQEEGVKVPDWVLNLLTDGHKSFYKEDNGRV